MVVLGGCGGQIGREWMGLGSMGIGLYNVGQGFMNFRGWGSMG